MYDVTYCLAAWSHVPFRGISVQWGLCPWGLCSGVSAKEGLCPRRPPSQIRKAGDILRFCVENFTELYSLVRDNPLLRDKISHAKRSDAKKGFSFVLKFKLLSKLN